MATPRRVSKSVSDATSEQAKAAQTTEGGLVLVANHHTAPIIFPRSFMQGEQRIALPPIVLEPGRTNVMDADEWAARKELPVIQAYLDHGLLGESKREGDVSVAEATVDTEANIPDNLQDSPQSSEGNTANVRRQRVGTVKVD